jgi:hypothetical protein
MAEWSIGELNEGGVANDEQVTWGDYGRAVAAGVDDVSSAINSGARFLKEKLGQDDDAEINKIESQLSQMDADDRIGGMSEAARKRITATVTSDEFWSAPFSAGALKSARMTPTLAASIVPAAFLAGPIAATAGAGAVGGALTASQTIDDIYKQVDAASDEQLQDASAYYRGLRDLGMPEKQARKDYTAQIRGNSVLLNFAIGAITNAIGPAGQVARAATKGGTAALGAGGRGVLGRVAIGAAEGAGSEGVEEGVQNATTQDALMAGGLQKEFDKDQLVNSVLEGGMLGGVFGGVASVKGHGAPHAAPNVDPAINPEVAPEVTPEVLPEAQPKVATAAPDKVEVVGPITPNAEQTEALAANEPAVPGPVAAAANRQRARKPAPQVVEPVTPEVTAPPADVVDASQRVEQTQPSAPAQVASVPFMITRAQREELSRRGYSPEAIKQMKPEDAQSILTTAPEAAAPVDEAPRAPRVLKSLTPEAQEIDANPVKPAYIEPIEKGAIGSKDAKRDAKRDADGAVAKKLFDEMVPEEAIPLPKNAAERAALKEWANAVVQRAKDAGVQIRSRVGGEKMPDHLVWLREVAKFAEDANKKGFVGKKADEKTSAFLGRQQIAKGGDFSVMREERRAEGEARKRQHGGTDAAERIGVAATQDGEIEGLSGQLSETAREEVTPIESNVTKKAHEEVAEVPQGDLSAPEKDAIETRVGTVESRKARPKLFDEEKAATASPVRKVEITEDAKKKALETIARLQKRDATPVPTKPDAPKAAEVKAKVAAKKVTSQVTDAPKAKLIKAKVAAKKEAAHPVEKAAAQVDTKPTEAQKEAGNYAKGHVKVQGLDITIENPRSSVRKGKDANGNEWSVKMPDHYGYVKRTEGADGDHVDVYVGKHPESQHVFVVDQVDPDTRAFDEHKVMLGYQDGISAVDAYDKAFSDGRGAERMGKITPMSVADFKEWLASGKTKKPAAELEGVQSALGGNMAAGAKRLLDRVRFGSGEEFPAIDGTPIRANRTIGLHEALKSISFDEAGFVGSKLLPAVRQRILQLVPDLKVHFVDNETMGRVMGTPDVDASKQAAGVHTDFPGRRDDHIVINQDSPAALSHVLLHEAVHAATTRALYADYAHPDAPVSRLIKSIMDEAIDANPLLLREYGFSNNFEFIAEAMSNPKLQEQLATIPLSDELAGQLNIANWKAKTVWQAIVSAVRQLLQLPPNYHTVLEGALRVSEYAMRETSNIRTTKKPYYDPQRVAAAHAFNDIHTQVTDMFKRAEGQEQKSSPRLLLLRTMDQLAQISERYFPGDNPVRKVADLVEKMRIKGERLLQESEPIITKLYELERKYRGEQWDAFTSLVHDETMADVHADRPLDQNKHLGKDTLHGAWGKAKHPELAARYAKLPEDLKQARRQAMDYFTAQQNKMSLGIIKNRVLKALGVEDAGLAQRIHENKTTPDDVEAVGGQHTLDLILDAKELSKIEGPYFPLMRRGDFVVRGRYNIEQPTKFIRKIVDENGDTSYEFATRKEALDWAKKQDARPTVKSTWVDKNTGERHFKDDDGSEVKVTSKDEDAEHRFRVTVQDQHVEFFKTKKEALAAAAEYEASPHFREVAGVEERRYETQDRHADMLSHQLQTLVTSMKRRPNYQDMSKAQKNELMQALNEASIRYLGSTRIQSKRLPRRYVKGASHDLTRNTLDYAQASANYLGKLEYQPQLEAATKEMLEGVRNDAAKSTSIGRSSIANEVMKRLDNNNGFSVENSKMNRAFQRVLTASFLDKLFSPAYNIVNSLQPAMVTMPVLSGRHGVARAFTELGKAYSDVAAYSVVKQGLRESARKAMLSKEHTTFLQDVISRLSDKGEQAMLKHLEEVGSLDPDAGLEIAELIKSRDGVMGKIDTGIGYLEGIARQMPKAIETINRSVTALAAYRLELSKTGDHAKAVRYAQETVNNTQGQYSSTNAAPAFNHPLLKLSLQFKKFGQMMYHLLGQQIGKALRNESPGDRAEALKTLAMLTTTHVAMAGALGLPTEPFKYLLMGLHAVIPGIPGWDDVENWERGAAANAFGKTGGELFSKGLPRALGIDLSSRVGLDSLVAFGEPKSEKKNDVWAYGAQLVAGAPGSLIADWISGINALGHGDVGKAAELMVPMKFASDAIKAYRMSTEGKKTDAGRSLAKPYSFGEAAARVAGFTPAREAEEGAKSAAFRSQTSQAKATRDGLVNGWVSARPADKAKAYRDVQQFNKTAPVKERIQMKDLTSASKRRDKTGTGLSTTARTKPTRDKLEKIYNSPAGNLAR